jgi:hypothetical protein
MIGMKQLIRQISKVKQLKEKEKHDIRKDKPRTREDLKMPTDFECLVCNTKFMTNEERKYHLRESTHGHFYDTTSPQEQEEVRSSENG